MRIFAPVLRLPLPRILKAEVPVEPILIALHALVAMLLGYGILVAPEKTLGLAGLGVFEPGTDRESLLPLAGMMLGGLGVTLLCLVPMTAPEVRRRIATGFLVTSLPTLMFVGQSGPAKVVAYFLVAVAILLARRGRFQQKWQDQIRETAAQQERNRLARDLHDSIKQQIFSVRLASATVEARWDSDPAGAREALAHVRRSAQEAAVEMQALLHQLRPEALANVGLVEALREQCEALGYRTGAQVTVEIGELPPEEQLPANAQDALFRIAQEALANVARHARATKVHVRLGRTMDPEDPEEPEDPATLELEVRDDGQGFDPDQIAPGIGLRSMKERLQPLGGRLEIASRAGAGARLIARLPLAPAGENPPSRPAVAHEEKAIQGMKGPGLMLAIMMVYYAADVDKEPAIGMLLSGLIFWFFLRSHLRSETSAPVLAVWEITKLYFFSFTFWALCAGWKSELAPWFVLPIAAWCLYWIVAGARRFYRLPRHSAGPGARTAFLLLLLSFPVGLPLLFLLGEPHAVARTCAAATALLYLAWWTWDTLEAEAR